MNNSDATCFLAELDRCRGLIRRLAPQIYDPEDIFQDVFIAAAHKRTFRDGPQPQAAWLQTVARNIAVRRHRHECVRQCQSLSTDPRSNDSREPIDALERDEGEAVVRRVVEALKPSYRHVIQRRFFADESLSEIADDLGIPDDTVRSRFKRAIHELKINPQLVALVANDAQQ